MNYFQKGYDRVKENLYKQLCEDYEKRGLWKLYTHSEKLRKCAEKYGERIALIDGQEEISYNELVRRSDAMAAYFLLKGFVKGDRIVIQHINCISFAVMCFGMFRIGVIPVLAMPSHREKEVGGIIGISGASGYIVIRSYHGMEYTALADKMQELHPDLKIMFADDLEAVDLSEYTLDEESFVKPNNRDTAIIVLSGGSTGIPKLIARTHSDYLHSQKYCALSCGMNEESVSLIAMPVTHNWNLCGPGLFGSIFSGALTILSRNGSADEILDYIERYHVTTVALVPSLVSACLDILEFVGDIDVSSLKMIQIGGALCSSQLAERAMQGFDCVISQIYGMGEGFVCATYPEDSREQILYTQGRPISPGDILKIVDENDNEVPVGEAGEIIARGPSVVTEYYGAPELTAAYFTEDGFYRTGDKGMIRPEDGYIRILGRTREQINRLGEKIMPSEIEEYLADYPDAETVCVTPADDLELGQRICLFIKPRDGADRSQFTLQSIRSYLAERQVATFKMPDQLVIVGEMPLTKVGKLDRKKMRELAEKGGI